jgi:hypothetical protein
MSGIVRPSTSTRACRAALAPQLLLSGAITPALIGVGVTAFA